MTPNTKTNLNLKNYLFPIFISGYECGAMSHAELISFLRSLPEVVEIKLYRDASRAQTPISTPTESEFSR